MRNKRFVSTVALVLAAIMVLGVLIGGISALAVSQSQIDALEGQRDEIRSRQADLKEQMDALNAEMTSTLELKEKLDEQNELTRQNIVIIDEQIELYDLLIVEKAEEVSQAEADEEYHYELYRAHVRAMEENSKWSYVAIIFQATSFTDFLARLDNIQEILAADQRIEAAYKQATEDLKTAKAEYEEVQASQKVKRYELLKEKMELEKDLNEATTMIALLEEDLEAYEAFYLENEALESEVQAKIDKMVEDLKAQEAAAAAAAAAAAQRNTTSSSTSAPSVSGSYYWPAQTSTYITSTFGYRVHPIFGDTRYHSGVDIAASYGDAISAAMSGTVTIAEYSASYGNYVVIYHSNGTTTLYAHMSSIAVSVGQTVSSGDTVGYCGSTGNSTGPHLHFEIRVNGSCVDPLAYYPNISFSYSSDA